jgi:hypothetical protein
MFVRLVDVIERKGETDRWSVHTGSLIENLEVKCHLGTPRLVWVDNTEMNLKEIRWVCAWDLSDL